MLPGCGYRLVLPLSGVLCHAAALHSRFQTLSILFAACRHLHVESNPSGGLKGLHGATVAARMAHLTFEGNEHEYEEITNGDSPIRILIHPSSIHLPRHKSATSYTRAAHQTLKTMRIAHAQMDAGPSMRTHEAIVYNHSACPNLTIACRFKIGKFSCVLDVGFRPAST
jgi:hypothetical protein